MKGGTVRTRGEIREVNESDMESLFCTFDNSEEAKATLGGGWWSHAAKQRGYEASKTFSCHVWKKSDQLPNKTEMGDVVETREQTSVKTGIGAWRHQKMCGS